MSLYAKRLKERVNWASRERGLTQEKIAEKVGIGRTRLRHYWDRGGTPDSETLTKLADILEVDLNWLFGRDVSPEWPKDDPLRSIDAKLKRLEQKING